MPDHRSPDDNDSQGIEHPPPGGDEGGLESVRADAAPALPVRGAPPPGVCAPAQNHERAGPAGRDRRDPARGDRRRGDEWRGGRRRTDRSRFLQRVRQPIIGLTLAGAALPLARVMQDGPRRGASLRYRDSSNGDPSDLSERLARHLDAVREAGERNSAVISAVQRFDIPLDLAEDIYDIARQERIPPHLAFGLVNAESTFRERVESDQGARGLTQLMPRTASWLVPGTTSEDLFDRRTNLRLGFRYLDGLIDRYSGDVKLALLAYNRGPATVDDVLARGGDPDNGYADRVLES